MERRRRKVIKGRPWPVQVRVGNDSPDAGVNAAFGRVEVNAHGHRADLLVIADDDQLVGKDGQRERSDVRLARLVNDQHVKVGGKEVKGREGIVHGHDPSGDGMLTVRHEAARLGLELRGAPPLALANALHGLLPAIQRLVERDVALRPLKKVEPGAIHGKLGSHPAVLATELEGPSLQVSRRSRMQGCQCGGVLLAPPGALDSSRHVRPLMAGCPRPYGMGPTRRHCVNLVEKLASAKVGPLVFKCHASPLDCPRIGGRILRPHRRKGVLHNGVSLAVATAEAALELGQAQPSLRLPPPGK